MRIIHQILLLSKVRQAYLITGFDNTVKSYSVPLTSGKITDNIHFEMSGFKFIGWARSGLV